MEMYVPMIAGEEEIPIKKYLYLILMKNQLGNVKECKTLIKKGYVMINDQCVKDPHYLVCKEDKIRVQGKVIEAMPFVYYMINKPAGYICAAHDQKYPCLLELIDRDDCYCVGRLDKDTTGFVLLTNDKSLSKNLLLPQNHVEKTYEVQTKLPITENYVEAFQKGMMIDRTYQCLPAELEIKDDYHCLVTICEGRYHQIKKMFLSMSNEVVSLKRIAFAHIVLDEQLKYGQYRQLNEDEMKLLQNALA